MNCYYATATATATIMLAYGCEQCHNQADTNGTPQRAGGTIWTIFKGPGWLSSTTMLSTSTNSHFTVSIIYLSNLQPQASIELKTQDTRTHRRSLYSSNSLSTQFSGEKVAHACCRLCFLPKSVLLKPYKGMTRGTQRPSRSSKSSPAEGTKVSFANGR